MLNERPFVTIVIGTDCPEWKSMTKDREEELRQEVISAVQKYFDNNDYNVGIEVAFACRPSDKITYSDQNAEDKDKIEGDIFDILGDVEREYFNKWDTVFETINLNGDTENFLVYAEDGRCPGSDDIILVIKARNPENIDEDQQWFEERFTISDGWQHRISECLNIRGFDEVDQHLFGIGGLFDGTFERR